MQVQVRTINVICAVLLVLAGFLIDNKVDARAIIRRSSDVSAEEYKRALVDALAYALVKSYGRREEPLWTETDTSGVAPGTLDIPDSNLWTETDTSGAAPGTLDIPDPNLWTEVASRAAKAKAVRKIKATLVKKKTKATPVKGKQSTARKHH
ncbi:unnamed protein product [Adineta steineri]|uniref:Uncharacterized protein n=1 Tax=Adineta steineri TaxID=433720 RepID=A0A819H656_9BILA|nr:unnamed protein product [Adineta steineri]